MKVGLASRAIWLFAVLLTTGCGMPRNETTSTQCVVGQDQSRTFLGKWSATPVRMALYQDSISDLSQDKLVVSQALETWNRFSTFSLGYPIIDYRDSNGEFRVSTVDIGSQPICSYNLLSDDRKAFVQPVMIHKRSNWPYASGIIALTTSCPVASGNSEFKMSIIEVNVQNYFAAGKPQPDATSILVHEVGHVLGLNHSCEYSKTKIGEGVPDCANKYIPKSYKTAVMFPEFTTPADGSPGEVRNKLNANDTGRTNCIYK